MKKGDDEIAMEFTLTYDNANAEVRGLKFQEDELTITRVSRLPQIGERRFERCVPIKPLIDTFLESGELVQGTEKGTRRDSFPTPWGEVVLYVCKFITCEGRFSLVFANHFKILNHLRH